MSYLNCPRCQLALRERDGHAGPESCPRCVGRLGVAVPLFRSRYPYYRRVVARVAGPSG